MSTWQDDDAATFGEGVARCSHPDCRTPMRFVITDMVTVLRCEMGHVAEVHPIWEMA